MLVEVELLMTALSADRLVIVDDAAVVVAKVEVPVDEMAPVIEPEIFKLVTVALVIVALV
jgi:hypothetical protein